MAINLQKGQRINLEKSSGAKLTQFCVGVNWGAIEYQVEEGGFLGFGKKTVTCAIICTHRCIVPNYLLNLV